MGHLLEQSELLVGSFPAREVDVEGEDFDGARAAADVRASRVAAGRRAGSNSRRLFLLSCAAIGYG